MRSGVGSSHQWSDLDKWVRSDRIVIIVVMPHLNGFKQEGDNKRPHRC